ncbi:MULTISPECIES: sugar transferase [Acidobacterium]|nr:MULTISPECIES: sugar transferase [Acidobacterium]
MATSEYLKSGKANQTPDPPEIVPRRGRSIAGVSVATPALRMFTDAWVILLGALIAILIRTLIFGDLVHIREISPQISNSAVGLLYLFWYVLAYLLVARRYGLYGQVPLRNGLHETRLVTQAALNAGLLLCGALYMTRDVAASRLLVIIFIVVSVVCLCVRRTFWRHTRYRNYARGIELRNVLILGTNRLSAAIGDQIAHHYKLGYHLDGFLGLPGSREDHDVAANRILGDITELRQMVRSRFVDELIIAQPCSTEVAVQLVEEARDLEVDLRAISGYFPDLSANAPKESVAGYPMVTLHRREHRTLALVFKRALDIALSLVAIVMLSPVLVAISAAILLEGGGGILYVSQRIGKRGRSFPCFKFRTMVQDAEAKKKELAALNERDGILFKVKNDPRITGVGRFLRKYSLDELPQFFNVLRGEMSLVGPRPPIASEVERYELEHLRRLEVLPGLTGLWQVQARQDSSFARYIALDTAYVENWSFWLDLTILLRTAGVVFKGTGS